MAQKNESQPSVEGREAEKTYPMSDAEILAVAQTLPGKSMERQFEKAKKLMESAGYQALRNSQLEFFELRSNVWSAESRNGEGDPQKAAAIKEMYLTLSATLNVDALNFWKSEQTRLIAEGMPQDEAIEEAAMKVEKRAQMHNTFFAKGLIGRSRVEDQYSHDVRSRFSLDSSYTQTYNLEQLRAISAGRLVREMFRPDGAYNGALETFVNTQVVTPDEAYGKKTRTQSLYNLVDDDRRKAYVEEAWPWLGTLINKSQGMVQGEPKGAIRNFYNDLGLEKKHGGRFELLDGENDHLALEMDRAYDEGKELKEKAEARRQTARDEVTRLDREQEAEKAKRTEFQGENEKKITGVKEQLRDADRDLRGVERAINQINHKMKEHGLDLSQLDSEIAVVENDIDSLSFVAKPFQRAKFDKLIADMTVRRDKILNERERDAKDLEIRRGYLAEKVGITQRFEKRINQLEVDLIAA